MIDIATGIIYHTLTFISEPLNLPEYHECQCRQSDREEYNQRESERNLFQMNVHIHAIETGNQCRKHQDY